MKKIGVQGEFPLRWPQGRPRIAAQKRKRARFKAPMSEIAEHLYGELRRLGANYALVSSNLSLKRNGMPYAKQPQPQDPAVVVYFDLNGATYCMACDQYDLVEDNMRAIGLTIEALRGIQRWGSGDMFQQAFSGFTHAQLQAPATGWREILGREVTTATEARRRYKEKAKYYHPDHVGSDEDMQRLNAALEEALAELQ